MNMILAVVEKNGSDIQLKRTAGMEDLKEYHPKCNDCENRLGIHGVEGSTSVFCKVWNRPVGKEEYCSKYVGNV